MLLLLGLTSSCETGYQVDVQILTEIAKACQTNTQPQNKCVVIESTLVVQTIPKFFTITEMLIVFCLLHNLLMYQKPCNYLYLLKVLQWEWVTLSIFAVQLVLSNRKAC